VAAEKEDVGVVVICPKCKVKLKVADEKIASEGTRFKCPKCSTVLLVRRPVPKVRPLDQSTVLVSHEDPSVLERLKTVLTDDGYRVITASDGISALVNATKELPFLAVLGVSIPKIYGFEVCKRLKGRPETKEMKIILIASIYDQNKYRRQPESFHGADSHIEGHEIETLLIGKINALKGIPERTQAPSPEAGKPFQEAAKTREMPEAGEKPGASNGITTEKEKPVQTPGQPQFSVANEPVEKAKRLARTILADIYLYSKAKVDGAIKKDAFQSTFAAELREGLKLYENRVSAEIRSTGDFYNEAVNNFIEKRKKELGQ
jgi:predicted Zn finger-like uncharacterized protein